MSKSNENWVGELLSHADVKVNGGQPWDIQVKNDKFFDRVARGGSLALGESYMDGWWEAEKLDEFFNKVISARLYKKLKFSWPILLAFLSSKLLNLQSGQRAFEVGEKHYDAGNDLYLKMLDKRLVYTCGYWKDAHNLDEAQEAKLDLVCRKIGLKAGEIGRAHV